MAQAPSVAVDLVQPFQVEQAGLRGRLVRLGPMLDRIIAGHEYPAAVAALLAEMTALAALLASVLKYDGVFTLQAKGKGPVRILVADVTSDGIMRAYAQFDAERLDPAMAKISNPVPALLGEGHLAFTVDQGADTERYQGIVELVGPTLAECVHHYFRQSEQIDAVVKVAVSSDRDAGDGTVAGWRAGAIMVQRLPEEPGPADDIDEDSWRETVALMGSVTPAELVDRTLSPHRLLYRLFHELGVRAFQPQGLAHGCRCSHARVARTLASFPRDEVLALMEDGEVSVRCEFCGKRYGFDTDAIEGLFDNRGVSANS